MFVRMFVCLYYNDLVIDLPACLLCSILIVCRRSTLLPWLVVAVAWRKVSVAAVGMR